eukprot:scaffold42965_cov45-Attheya_sp.AAC.2
MYNAAPKFQERQKLHAICVLGQRWTGRPLLCSSSTGRLFAAKIFNVIRYKQFLKELENERLVWNQFRTDECIPFCNVRKMNYVPDLTIPFYPRVPFGKKRQLYPS